MSSLSAAGLASGSGASRDLGIETGSKGEVFVGATLIMSTSVGTVDGVTFSTTVKAGRRRTVVGSEYEVVWCGVGMLDADTIKR